MEKSESIKELAIALNKAQATLQIAKKGCENPFFHSKYADLLAVWDACRGALTSNGLSIAQIADTDFEGKAVLETILMHTSGEWIKGRLPLLSVRTDPQAQGSAITYARRYSLSAIIGLCTEEDDDAEIAMNRGKGTEIKGHWCSIHKTPFFKRGNMKGYAHPIKDTGEWCNESPKALESSVGIEPPGETITEEDIKEALATQTFAETESQIDKGWLKESLDKLRWKACGSYLKSKYHIEGTSVASLISQLNKQQAEEFVKEVRDRLNSSGIE